MAGPDRYELLAVATRDPPGNTTLPLPPPLPRAGQELMTALEIETLFHVEERNLAAPVAPAAPAERERNAP